MAHQPSPTSQALAEALAASDPDRRSADPGMPPPRLWSIDRIRGELESQKEDLRALERVAREAGREAEAVDPDLVPGVKRDRIARVREEARRRAVPVVERMRGRAEAARAQAPLHSRDAVLLRQKFRGDPAADAAQRTDWRERLRSGSDRDLLEAARLAASTRNLALAAVVQEVARSREFEVPGADFEVEAVLAGVEVPASDRALAALAEVADLAVEGELAAREAAVGHRDPGLELAAALRERRAG